MSFYSNFNTKILIQSNARLKHILFTSTKFMPSRSLNLEGANFLQNFLINKTNWKCTVRHRKSPLPNLKSTKAQNSTNNSKANFFSHSKNSNYLKKELSEFKFKMRKNFHEKKDQIFNCLSSFFLTFLKKVNFTIKSKLSKPALKKPSYYAYLPAAAFFSWNDFRVEDDEVKHEVNSILKTFSLDNSENKDSKGNVNYQIDFERARHFEDEEWKKIYDKKDLIIWRRELKLEQSPSDTDYDLYEYKVLGRMNDVTPIEFYQTQIDVDFRKEWDYLVVSLEVIQKDFSTTTELVSWIMKFPYPLSPRGYIFVRRYCIEPTEKLLILIARSVPENIKLDPKDYKSKYPVKENFVRVGKYKSNMIIIPHEELNKKGFNYVIQYYDVNKAKIPKIAYKWMASAGLPDFIDKLHAAALKLRAKNGKDVKKYLTVDDILKEYELFYINEVPKVELIEEQHQEQVQTEIVYETVIEEMQVKGSNNTQHKNESTAFVINETNQKIYQNSDNQVLEEVEVDQIEVQIVVKPKLENEIAKEIKLESETKDPQESMSSEDELLNK